MYFAFVFSSRFNTSIDFSNAMQNFSRKFENFGWDGMGRRSDFHGHANKHNSHVPISGLFGS